MGGGSTTGTAKAIALELGLPIIAVPTTYAGSEVTPVWGLTERSRKTTGTDRRVLPKLVVYDPELTLTLPPGLSGTSGINAVAHSAEALWSPRRNPVTSLIAEESIRALANGLPAVVADPSSIQSRSQALYGAWLAGTAFANVGSYVHHKICHVLGGAYNLPHAETHTVVLPYSAAVAAPRVDGVGCPDRGGDRRCRRRRGGPERGRGVERPERAARRSAVAARTGVCATISSTRRSSWWERRWRRCRTHSRPPRSRR